MFGKTPYYALNQMTKMGIRTGPDCRSDVPGLLAAGPRAGRLRQSFRRLPHRAVRRQRLDRRAQRDRGSRPAAAAATRCGRGAGDCTMRRSRPLDAGGEGRIRPHPARPAGGDVRLRHRHPEARRPAGGGATSGRGAGRAMCGDCRAPHTHELVRLKETEAMLLAARFILGASLVAHRIAAQPFPRGPSSPRRRQLAGLGRHRTRSKRTGIDPHAHSDAVLPGDASGPTPVPSAIALGWPRGGGRGPDLIPLSDCGGGLSRYRTMPDIARRRR